ncbi:MAG: dihydroneopterin aldolase, partial [Proteobacteria bacterium]|nr:dihydroneopterin aldolase [Pseudomonadota bacterium]
MSRKTTRVFIRDLELLARIGVHGREQGMPQPIRINVELRTDTAPTEDRLHETVDYESVA